MRRVAVWIFLLAVACLLAVAKDQPFQVVSWPDSGQLVLRFTFSKFKDVGRGMGRERTYISDVEALNLSDKTITGASFSFYVFDKGKARIGEGYINSNEHLCWRNGQVPSNDCRIRFPELRSRTNINQCAAHGIYNGKLRSTRGGSNGGW